ncbi:protein yebF, partial [Yersinia pestis PY-36]
MYRLL